MEPVSGSYVKGPLGITAQRCFRAPIESTTCDLDVELRIRVVQQPLSLVCSTNISYMI